MPYEHSKMDKIASDLEQTTDAIMRAYSERYAPLVSEDGRIATRQKRNGLLRLIADEWLGQLRLGKRARNYDAVRAYYEEVYAHSGRVGFHSLDKYNNFFSSDTIYRSQTGAYRLASIHAIARILGDLDVETVCEGGCGIGSNLFYLSSILPKLTLSGFDLSENAVGFHHEQLAAGTRFELGIPETLAIDLGSTNVSDATDMRIFQSSMDLIDLDDNGVDVLFTHAALEQCRAILPEALSEIRRVAARYAIFYEPFADANSLLERTYLHAKNYFCISVDDLEKHGFRVVYHCNQFTSKPTFAYSLAVCEPV